jgi:hypothetical protein
VLMATTSAQECEMYHPFSLSKMTKTHSKGELELYATLPHHRGENRCILLFSIVQIHVQNAKEA